MLDTNNLLRRQVKNGTATLIEEKYAKFSYVCFQFLDDMLIISIKLENLKQHYPQQFIDFEMVERVCNIYMDVNAPNWEKALDDIEDCMPIASLFPLRDIKRGFEQQFINAFIENYNKYWNEKKFRVSFTSISDTRIHNEVYRIPGRVLSVKRESQKNMFTKLGLTSSQDEDIDAYSDYENDDGT